MITRAGRTGSDVTLIVTGVGPVAGSNDPSLQVDLPAGHDAARLADLGQHPAARASSPSPT